MMGLKLKVLTSKQNPRWWTSRANLEDDWRLTKGLKILKIKRDGFLVLCLTNPYRHRDPVESEPGLDGIKTISIPLNF